MALISTKLHGVLDYAGGAGSLAAPKLLRDRRAGILLAATGAGTLATSSLTDYEVGVVRKLPMRVHLLADAGTGALLLAGAYLLRRGKSKALDWAPLVVVGVTEIAAAALTERQPGDRGRGGAVTPDAGDPAMDPVYQAGGGEQEGFEQAESELIENAIHGDGGGQPERDAFAPELESDRTGAVYGEADRIASTEVVEDPGAGSDDPAAGPGLTADRDVGVRRGQERPPRE